MQEKSVITNVAFGKEGKNLLIGTASNALLKYDTTSFQVIPWAPELKPVLQHKLQSMPGSITNISILPNDKVLRLTPISFSHVKLSLEINLLNSETNTLNL